MLSKRTHPMIGKLSELLVGINRSTAATHFLMTSPKSPLDFKILPQRNSSKRFYDENLGGSVGLGIVVALENSTSRITSVCKSEPNRSDPVHFTDEEMFIMDDEDFTMVTSSCSKRVYDKDGFVCKINEDHRKILVGTESPEFQGLDFLSSCYLCRKNLHGEDIYIYRGERGFCSMECRSSHIENDEKKEICKLKFSTSPYTTGEIFSAGVLLVT